MSQPVRSRMGSPGATNGYRCSSHLNTGVFVVVILLLTLFHYMVMDGNMQDDPATRKIDEIPKPIIRYKWSNQMEKPGQTIRNRDNSNFTSIQKFLKSDPDNIMDTKQMEFLSDVRNPCFAESDNWIGNGELTLKLALHEKWKIHCLPAFYLAGFTKSGTGDLFKAMSVHPKILYQRKELHFWDNTYWNPDYNIQHLAARLAKPKNEIIQRAQSGQPIESQPIIADGTPRVIWDGDHWQYDVINQASHRPDVLIPHKIHHMTPDAKFIVIMREPASRLVSDYKFFTRVNRKVDPRGFHDKVVRSIQWWNDCIQKHPESLCLYGPAPADLTKLDIDYCIENKAYTWRTMKHKPKCISIHYWSNNTADRLRVGFYELFISTYLKVVPRENMLFLKFEEYIADPIGTLMDKVYPFLNLRNLTNTEKTRLSKKIKKVKNKSSKKLKLLPETLELLRNFYAPFNERLRDLLGDDKWLWQS